MQSHSNVETIADVDNPRTANLAIKLIFITLGAAACGGGIVGFSNAGTKPHASRPTFYSADCNDKNRHQCIIGQH